METIKFSHNWNNKLTNKAFTTLRLHNPNKYQRGGRYMIECNGQTRGVAVLQDIRTFTIASLNDFITHLDTGYNVTETVQLFKRMYKNKSVNWETQKLDFCLLVYEKKTNEPETLFLPIQANILETIKQIEHEKQAARVVPSYAVCLEICKRLRIAKPVLLCELEKMKTAGVVFEIGNTGNDNYILLQPLKNYLF